jgi:aldehyde dehydrogenase (NAD+)
VTSAAKSFHANFGAMWGSRDPDDTLVALARREEPGSPFLLVDGQLTKAASGARFDNVNPTTERVMGSTADAGAADVERAVVAARRAFDETDWLVNHGFRRRCLEQLHAGLVKVADRLRATATNEVRVGLRSTYGFHSDASIALLPWFAELAETYTYDTRLPDRPWAPEVRRIVAR